MLKEQQSFNDVSRFLLLPCFFFYTYRWHKTKFNIFFACDKTMLSNKILCKISSYSHTHPSLLSTTFRRLSAFLSEPTRFRFSATTTSQGKKIQFWMVKLFDRKIQWNERKQRSSQKNDENFPSWNEFFFGKFSLQIICFLLSLTQWRRWDAEIDFSLSSLASSSQTRKINET